MEQVTIYHWPDSQLCLDCSHRDKETICANSGAICTIGCPNNNGVLCPYFEQDVEQNEE